ncbi:hypothetical protein EYR40_010471 [Pleurotus pulmonarius]|nr:hypothetical protein EYR36_010145 [Pleurotus pulmonarius]KAF4588916.1 hypothetical protein EYR40_010471 [Pleurotus pulmonarius]
MLLEELPRGYILFANIYNKEPLITTKFSTIDRHRNLVIGRGPSLKFLGITTDPPRQPRGYDGYEQIERPREDGLDGLERKILGVVGGILQGREGIQPFGGVGTVQGPLPPPGSYHGRPLQPCFHPRDRSQGTSYGGVGGGAYCGNGGGVYRGGSGRGGGYRGGSYRGTGQTRTIFDYRDSGIHAFAGRTPAHHPNPLSVDNEVHEDFMMDGTPAPDYLAVAGPSSYDPMVARQSDDLAGAPVETTEVVEDEGKLTEDSVAPQDGDDTEDDEDI